MYFFISELVVGIIIGVVGTIIVAGIYGTVSAKKTNSADNESNVCKE